jgi:hypothetical protein
MCRTLNDPDPPLPGFPPSVLVPASCPSSPLYRPGPAVLVPASGDRGAHEEASAVAPRSKHAEASASAVPREDTWSASRSRPRSSSRGRAPQERSWFWKLTNPQPMRNSGSANTHRPGGSSNQRALSPPPFAPRTPRSLSPVAAPAPAPLITLQPSVPLPLNGFVPGRSASPYPEDRTSVLPLGIQV